MSRLIRVACVAVMLAACARLESGPPMSPLPEDPSASRLPLSAPDVAAARAEEAAALHDIDVNMPPGEGKDHLLDVLTGKLNTHSGNSHTVHMVSSDNPAMQARFDRFYAARRHLGEELRREASVDAARNRGAVVVLALGNPPNGAVAAVMRRRLAAPDNVIVLGPNATAATLAAAFAEFDRLRELTGDDFDDDHVIPVQAVGVTATDAKDRTQMDELLAKVRKATMQPVEDVGNVQAIATDSRTRKTVEFSIEKVGVFRSHYLP